MANEADTACSTYEAVTALLAQLAVPCNEPVTPALAFILPEKVLDPDTENCPVESTDILLLLETATAKFLVASKLI